MDYLDSNRSKMKYSDQISEPMKMKIIKNREKEILIRIRSLSIRKDTRWEILIY